MKKMRVLYSFAIVYLFVAGTQALTCYFCEDHDSINCPKDLSDAAVLKSQTCGGTLSHSCAKYYIDLLNGESIVYRSCAPEYIGGTAADSNNLTFCEYNMQLLQPLIIEGLRGWFPSVPPVQQF
ncbi:uncharacterized protein LOC115876542 [Sitophilus oryzae]|uniref:Uncharacterized protein LOC115876542 n=1 Tax=Sitophilus oryzae TaxID=7048 RepID=A0A6J2XBN6_SITOR|nr:uncharacterized protein LOC115876542 [Sitophilus oryzae]